MPASELPSLVLADAEVCQPHNRSIVLVLYTLTPLYKAGKD